MTAGIRWSFVLFCRLARGRIRGIAFSLRNPANNLDYSDITLDARRRIARESNDISGEREDLCIKLRLKHGTVLSNPVLAFGCAFQAFRIDAFKSNKPGFSFLTFQFQLVLIV
jgi:hypothetical protein